MMKIRKDAAPRIPWRKVGTRLLRNPRILNAANMPRHGPGITARVIHEYEHAA
jgi:hypothetical protein